ncbi:MAG TPA: dihydroxy-acid dehydratase [Phycisphaerae bacterium]|nr:dihydroxy-acid dehydratase [Phycisphaerae bacterium]HOJ75127.1 dihydroxy-acid dehydratase [Phycisphaerae bacterium]HON64936.1 dihydroxy-acid dehydratase [Phycisphaerae bacterium]HPP27470.1 dihydroxy-acid dehydratase [Phycisphaerae bacterium]HPU26052.1 dihydroxy-acid dehydratase [Phycisphaerae bacterium]
MRSDLIKRGVERAPHRSLLKGTGNYRDEDLDKPFIAVVNSYVDIIPGHAHLDSVGYFIKDAVREAGGVPFIFNTIGVDDGIAMGHLGMKFSLPSRELIADSVETMIEAHRFDAMICIPNCDKIVPGMLMAAARCNIPTLFVSGGPMEAGRTSDGTKVDLISAFYAVSQYTSGAMTEKQVADIENSACPTCGSCSGMFTANSMNCLCEALGMALPGNGTILATSEDRKKLYAAAAERIVELAKAGGPVPREIMTRAAFDNAMILDMAMGGSTNTVLHILAIAHEAGVKFTMADIDALSRKTPNICRLAPSSGDNGRMYHMEDCHASGGIMTILGEIMRGKPGLLNTEAITVTGKTLGENIKENDIRVRGEKIRLDGISTAARSSLSRHTMYANKGGAAVLAVIEENAFDPYDCIRTVEKAYTPEGGLSVLYGNIAQEGAIVKTAGVDKEMLRHTGPAIIFESQEEACEGILAGKVKPGMVVVIRYEGPKGGPGMQEMLAPTSYIKGNPALAKTVALITDGRFSGGTAGACIGHVSPEAARGGAIALLRDGDIIEIDIPARTLNVKLSEAELAERRKTWKAPEPRYKTGYLAKYTSMATSAATGAVLKWD